MIDCVIIIINNNILSTQDLLTAKCQTQNPTARN